MNCQSGSCAGPFNENCQRNVFARLLLDECAKPRPDVTKALFYISQNPNPALTDTQGNDALNLCAQGKDETHMAIMAALLDNPDAPRNRPNAYNMTAAMNARIEDNPKMAALLAADPAVDLGFIAHARTPEWLCAQWGGDAIGEMYQEKHSQRKTPQKAPGTGTGARVS